MASQPAVRTDLASLVEDFRAHARQTAIVAHRGNRRYATTYGELAHLAGRFAAELDRRGITPGERVVIWGDNSAEWIAAFFGCVLRGVLAVPLDAGGSRELAQRVVDDVGPRLVVSSPPLMQALRTHVPAVSFSGFVEQLPVRSNLQVSPAVREDAPFQIIFTSGTTAEPKGIVHTHRNVLASLRPIESEIRKYRNYERWVHPLRFLHTLPLSHVFGQFMGLWVPALLAAEVYFSDGVEAARMMELIRSERVSVLVAVPRVLELLRAQVLRRYPRVAHDLEAKRGLPLLKRWWRFRAVHGAFGWKFWAAISGGAAVPAELERFWNTLGFALIQGYGMTETAALVTLNHPFRIGKGTIGRALPGREVRLSAEGEILVRGDMVSTATWQGGRLRTHAADWLATGDLGEASASGDLRFAGRKGEAIVTAAGLNVHPSDLEAALLQQPGVRGCVVVPWPAAQGLEPVAVLLWNGSEEAMWAAVRAANAELAPYQQVRRALRWPMLHFPYTSTGKLLRREVAAWVEQAALDRAGAPGPSFHGDPLLSLIAEVTGERATSAPDHARLSEDLHLDSLGRVQLASAIEQRMGIVLADHELAGIATLGELRAFILRTEAVEAIAEASAETAHGASGKGLAAGSVEFADAGRGTVRRNGARHVYPHWPWSLPVLAMRVVFIEALLRPLVQLLAAPRIFASTRELSRGPVLIIANHVTALDAALVLAALPRGLRRRVTIAMSGEMLADFRSARGQGSVWRNMLGPAAYWLLTALLNVFPLPRLHGFSRSFAHAGEALDRGYSVLLFPEGRRNRAAAMLELRPGIGLLAQQSQVDVLPIALRGLTTRQWFRSGRIEVRIGEVVRMPEGTTPAEWTRALDSALQQLQLD